MDKFLIILGVMRAFAVIGGYYATAVPKGKLRINENVYDL